MSDNIRTFETLLERCLLRKPAAPEVRSHAIRLGRDVSEIIKKSGEYGILLAFTLKIFFILRSIGIKGSFLQIKILIGLITSAAVVAVPAGGYYVVKYIIDKKPPLFEDEIDQGVRDIAPAGKLSVQSTAKEETVLPVKFEIGIAGFTGNADKRNLIEKRIKSGLLNFLGKDRATILPYSERSSVAKIITGTAQKLGGKYMVTAKIINVDTSRVEHVIFQSGPEAEIDKICSDIVAGISEKIK